MTDAQIGQMKAMAKAESERAALYWDNISPEAKAIRDIFKEAQRRKEI